jgi:methylmalonyl-CoA mutase cobalamin-binding subunit
LSTNLCVQDIKALIRKSSLEKPAVQALGKKGIKVIAADLDGPEAELVESLRGVDIVISAIDAAHLMAQISLANACKVAGVNRFVPCHFATIAPPKGVHILRDIVRIFPAEETQIEVPIIC